MKPTELNPIPTKSREEFFIEAKHNKEECINVFIPHASPDPDPPTHLSTHDLQVEFVPSHVKQLGSHTTTNNVTGCGMVLKHNIRHG